MGLPRVKCEVDGPKMSGRNNSSPLKLPGSGNLIVGRLALLDVMGKDNKNTVSTPEHKVQRSGRPGQQSRQIVLTFSPYH